MKTWQQHTDIYIDLQAVTDLQQWLSDQDGTLICDQTGCLGWRDFFVALSDFEEKRASKRKQTKNVQAKSLEVLLPVTLLNEHISQAVKAIMAKIFSGEEVLPYAAWLVTRGKGRYVRILISERYYSDAEYEYVDRWNAPRYRSTLTGKLCKCDDPHAEMIVKQGDIRKQWRSHFSLKSRIFSADGFAKKSKDRKERIGFDRLLKHLRQCVVAAFVSINIPFTEDLVIPKIKRKKTMNRWQSLNVSRINTAIRHIQDALQMEWIALRDGYFLQDSKIKDRFMAFAKKYLNRIKKGSFRLDLSSSRSLRLAFSPWMNVVTVQDNITSLLDTFDEELEKFQWTNRYGL